MYKNIHNKYTSLSYTLYSSNFGIEFWFLKNIYILTFKNIDYLKMDSNTRIVSGVRLAVMLAGLIGNIITIIIFSRPVFQKNSISIYCRALAVFESYTIVHLAYEFGIAFFGYYLGNYSDLLCILYTYVNTAFGPIPGWILIAFSIDKLLNMKNIGNSLIKKLSFQLIIIASIVMFNLLLYIEIPIYQRLKVYTYGNMTYVLCSVSTLPFGVIVSWIYLIEGNILTFLIMIVTSVISIRLIRKSSKNVSPQLVSSDTRRKRDIKFAVTSIAFNLMFIVLRLPVIMISVLSFFIPSLALATLPTAILYLLYFVNNSNGLIVHLVSNNIFRREFLVLFRLKKISEMNHFTMNSNTQINANQGSNLKF